MILLKGARLIDPASGIDEVIDLAIEENEISNIGNSLELKNLQPSVRSTILMLGQNYENFQDLERFLSQDRQHESNSDIIIDATGKILCPGFFDMHTHLREPGREDEETLRTGAQAAAAGGFTGLACMPNTQPAIDTAVTVEYILSKARQEAILPIFPIGCLTKNRAGKELAEIGELKEAGVIALSDDGSPITESQIMRRILEYAKIFDLPVLSHSEDLSLSEGGSAHEGWISTLRGLPGIPRESEEVAVARDISIAALAKAPIHICHLSSRGSLEIIRRARESGLKVTCEVTPHHLILTEKAVSEFDTNAKINPPLRDEQDREALCAALKEGLIDAVATDHAPHLFDEKDIEFNRAAFGMLGLETAVSLLLDKLVKPGYLTLAQLVERLAIAPRKILKLPYEGLKVGAVADLTLLDLEAQFPIKKEWFFSESRNTPFESWNLHGGPILTLSAGKIVFARIPGQKGTTAAK